MNTRLEISKKLVIVNSASSLATRMINISVLIWLQQYLLKRITPEEYSLLPVLYSVMMFAPLITTVLTAGLGRYIVEAYAKHDDERVTQIVSTMFPILCAAGLGFLGCGWTFAWYIDKVLNIAPERLWDARVMMSLLMFSAAIALPLSPFGVGVHVRQKFVLQNLIQLGTVIFRLVILFILLFGVSTRILWVVTATVSAEILNLTILMIVSRHLLPTLRFRPSHIHWPIAKELTSFGGWSFVAQLADTIRTSADPIILNRLGTTMDVNCLYLGTLVMKHMHALLMGLVAPLGPALIGMHAMQAQERLKRTYLRAGRIALWAALLPSLPLMIYSDELVKIYAGEAYSEAASVMLVSLLLFPLMYGFLLVPAIANAMGRIRGWALILVGMNSLNILITLYLVGYQGMGAFGSALATILSIIIVFPIFVFPYARSLMGVKTREWLFETAFFGLLPGAGGLVVWLGLKPFTHNASWVTLGLCIGMGGAFYLLILFFLALRKSDRDDLSLVIGRVRLTRIAKSKESPC